MLRKGGINLGVSVCPKRGVRGQFGDSVWGKLRMGVGRRVRLRVAQGLRWVELESVMGRGFRGITL